MTDTGTLERTDTGTHAVVRVIDPDVPVSAPYSRAVGVAVLHDIDQWAGATIDRAVLGVKRRFYDDLDRIIADCLDGARLPKQWPTVDDLIARRQRQEQTAEWPVQVGSVKWAELPEVRDPLPPVLAGIRGRYGTIGEPSPYDPNPPTGRPVHYDKDRVQAYFDADDPDDRPGRVAWVNVDGEPGVMPARIVPVGRVTLTPRDNPLAQAYAKTAALARQRKAQSPNYPDTPEQIADQEATTQSLADGQHEARGWTPDPADYGPLPALVPAIEGTYTQPMPGRYRGPRNALARRVDAWLQRAEQWWRERRRS